MEEMNFDYKQAIASLENIARRVEDPQTGLEEIDALLAQSEELIAKCRAYLRSSREKLSANENI